MIQSMRYIKTLTGSGVNTVQDSYVFRDNPFRNFIIVVDRCDISSGTNNPGIRLVTSADVTLTANYRYGVRNIQAGSSITTASSANDNRFNTFFGTTINTEQGGLLVFKIYNPMEDTRTPITSFATIYGHQAGYQVTRQCAGIMAQENIISGFNFFIDSVTFDAFRCHIYGEK